RQQELARQTEAARLRAEQQAKAQSEAEKRQQDAKKQQAYGLLLAQGQGALRQGNYSQAVQSLQGAVAMKPNDQGFPALAEAKARLGQANGATAADEQARREAELKKQRDAELARVRDRVQQQREAKEIAQRLQNSRDEKAYKDKIDQAKALLDKKQFDQTVTV